MGRQGRYPAEVRERADTHFCKVSALHPILPAIDSIAAHWDSCDGCCSNTKLAPSGAGHRHRPGLTTSERERLKELERENRELKRANEILRKASAFFAQAELDRRPK